MKRIELDNLPNTRDLGGMKNKDGKVIKKHKLIRSGQLIKASARDLEILTKEYHLKQIIDFRSMSEKEENPDPTIAGVKYVYNPIMKEITKGITRDKKSDQDTVKMIILDMANDLKRAEAYMENIYEELINDEYALAQYAKFLDLVLNNEEGATLWHCTAGKDRAGFATFLVLECLNVSKETIIEDYLLTNVYAQNDINNMINSIKKEYDFPLISEVVHALFGIKREYLEKVYDTIEKKYGTMQNFLFTKMGMNEEKIAKMQAIYLK